MSTLETVRVRVTVVDEAEARATEQALTEAGASEVGEIEQVGIAPILVIVIGAVIAIAAIGDFIEKRRRRHMCQEILDCRSDEVKITNNCDHKDGSIVVLSKDGQKVEITDVPPQIDLTEVTKAALTATADAVKKAAEAAGAKASDPQPATPTPAPAPAS